jgi:ABC-2 type transport system permease protein
MNILKRELRAGLKPFIFWTLGLFVLIFLGIMKFEGVSTGGADISALIASLPRIVQAVLGIVGVDINTLGGYTAILTYYVLICAVIYAVHLGSAAVSRESVDKTYEFVFTKPCSRGRVLSMKLLASWIYLLLFCLLYVIFSLKAAALLKSPEDITVQTELFALSVFLIGSLFVSLSAFLASASRQPDKGSLWGNLAFLYAFILGVVYDLLENGGLLRLISPFKYFLAPDILAKELDPIYAVLTVFLSAVLLWLAFGRFNKKDMT